jgi:hypothetical protein
MVWNEACQQWAAFTTLKPDRSEKKKGAAKKKDRDTVTEMIICQNAVWGPNTCTWPKVVRIAILVFHWLRVRAASYSMI